MGDEAAAIGLAGLAEIFRAEAANGLYWGAADDELERLRRLRAHAAALTAMVDRRSEPEIRAVFDADRGIRSPCPATEFRVRCADGATLVRRRRLNRSRPSLGERLAAASAALRAAPPTEVAGIGDTGLAGLPCPQTYLLVYEIDTPLRSAEADRALEPSDPDLEGVVEAVAPSASAAAPEREPVAVAPEARRILDLIIELCEEGDAATSNFYELERHQRVADLCRRTVDADVDYPQIDCGDLATECFTTGADAAIFDDGGRLLLIQRTDTGQWAMPGGGFEVGETVGAAAVREAREETGLDITLTGLSWAFDKRDVNFGDSRMPMIMSFTARRNDPGQPIRLAELEASDHRWIARDEIEAIDFFRGHELRVPRAFETHRRGVSPER